MRKILVGLGAAGLVAGSLALPAGAATQTGTQTIDATLSSSFTMSLTDGTVGTAGAPWVLNSSGANSRAAGNLDVSSNSPYTVTVLGEMGTLTEHDGAAYVVAGKALAAPTLLTTTSSVGTGVGTPASAVGNSVPTAIATGGLSSDTFTLNMSQATTIADSALAAGRTYHNLFTYTGTSAL